MTLFKGDVVVFDIDDTLIYSNGYCINPIIDVFNFVKSIGVIPIIITNRSGDEKTIEFTKKQLQSSGIFGQKYIYIYIYIYISVNLLNQITHLDTRKKHV
jgi:hypothetical protein